MHRRSIVAGAGNSKQIIWELEAEPDHRVGLHGFEARPRVHDQAGIPDVRNERSVGPESGTGTMVE
jgi:hypothetical protein